MGDSSAKRVASPEGAPRWEIFTHGGRTPTGIDAVEFARRVVALGAGEILLTSMDRDGTKAGFDIGLTRAVSDAVSVPVIASGGVGSLDHLSPVCCRAARRRFWRPRFSTSAPIRSLKPSSIWPKPAFPCASTRPPPRPHSLTPPGGPPPRSASGSNSSPELR